MKQTTKKPQNKLANVKTIDYFCGVENPQNHYQLKNKHLL